MSDESKKPKKDEEDGDNEEEEEVVMASDDESDGEGIEMDVDDQQEIKKEYVGYDMQDNDFHGVKLLLDRCCPQLGNLTDALLKQNMIGTVLKEDECPEDENDDTVYSVVTCYSMTRVIQDQALTSFRNMLLSKCKASSASKDDKNKFAQIMNKSWSEANNISSCDFCVGIFINERIYGWPLAKPMFESLMTEIETAKSKMRGVRHDFTHYLMICKMGKDQNDGEWTYMQPEEENFAKEASISFDYLVPDQVRRSRRVLLIPVDRFHQAISQV